MKKFLALKLAEIADAIREPADHLATNHSNDTAPDACANELMVGVVKLAAVLNIARINGLVESPAPSEVAEIRASTRSAVVNEALSEMLSGHMTGGIVV